MLYSGQQIAAMRGYDMGEPDMTPAEEQELRLMEHVARVLWHRLPVDGRTGLPTCAKFMDARRALSAALAEMGAKIVPAR